ncbi:MAG TPA: AAA family ATPase, partial [Caldimonas sp.]|nr:AAA family ATPase [Caldimonas sp.]
MSSIDSNELADAAQRLRLLRDEIGKAMVGQNDAIEQLLVAIMASGHVLIEGVPGLGKTLLARALAKAVALRYARIQFTPDMLPSDITGHAVLDPAASGAGGLGALRIRRGPVFTNILLADEINRAPAKTQSALLEVMQEYQVSLEGETLPLERP